MTKLAVRRWWMLWTLGCCWMAGASLAAAAAVPNLPKELDPLVQNIDPSVKPGDDFFRYANGTWFKKHPIPAAEHSWGLAYLVIDAVRGQLRSICQESADAKAPAGSLQQLVGDFWVAGMDSMKIERQGVEALRPELNRIDAIRSRDDLLAAISLYHVYGVGPLYGFYVGQDDKNSEQYVVFLYQSGLGLPDRDYYFLDDAATAEIRAEYPKHIAKMMQLLGQDAKRAEQAAASIMDLETRLARSSRTLEDLRDPYANYNKMAVKDLNKKTSRINWTAQFQGMGVAAGDSVVVGQPEFFATADSCVQAIPLEVWKDYLRWSLVNTFANRMSKDFDLQDFKFYGQLLQGRETQRPRWKRVLDAEEDGIGELMGQIWVQRYCSPKIRARYETLVEDFFSTYSDRIKRLDWMSNGTKERALEKLSRVGRKVCYPDKWRDFSTLKLDRASFAANQMKVNEWQFRHRANKLGKPVDRTEWDMTPQTYNAYYNTSSVEIVLPYGVFMVPGLPDSLMDDAILYANAGAGTIGHEITHGFDDQGRQYDAHGNLHPWWTEQDSAQFTQRAQGLIDQYNSYVVGERHVRGEATLGENIADLGGMVIGYEAFKKTEQWKSGKKLNGLTPDQRFFLAYAFAWMSQQRPEYLDQQIMSDVHSPAFLRVNGSVVNVPGFRETFGIKPGETMYKSDADIVKIW